jgi:hypothetical protein
LTLILLASCALALRVADGEGQVFLDPAKAGPEYAIQGEYLGLLGPVGEQQRWGAQVIALGDGKFELVGYEGGLPGDGWSRGGRTLRTQGELSADNSAHFKTDEAEVTIRNGELAVKHGGENVGSILKVNRKSPTLGAKPPAGAVILFDGTSAEHFAGGQLTEGDLLAADCETKQKFGDHTLHIEFRTPFKPEGRGQDRGNSGVYAQNRYEIQVLDSFGLEGLNNECGGIYSIAQPAVNMCYPPLTWQTYDIEFQAARYNDQGQKTANARITVRHNGVVIHNNIELPHGTPGKNPEGPEKDGIYLQGHGNPVVYRNVWVVEK